MLNVLEISKYSHFILSTENRDDEGAEYFKPKFMTTQKTKKSAMKSFSDNISLEYVLQNPSLKVLRCSIMETFLNF